MNEVLSKIYENVSNALQLNSATLSGAIDIVVVEHPPGSIPACLEEYGADRLSTNESIFVSTPFHVRFGKLRLLNAHQQVVAIIVNGNSVDCEMELGRQGEAFFRLPADSIIPLRPDEELPRSPSKTKLSMDEKEESEQKQEFPPDWFHKLEQQKQEEILNIVSDSSNPNLAILLQEEVGCDIDDANTFLDWWSTQESSQKRSSLFFNTSIAQPANENRSLTTIDILQGEQLTVAKEVTEELPMPEFELDLPSPEDADDEEEEESEKNIKTTTKNIKTIATVVEQNVNELNVEPRTTIKKDSTRKVQPITINSCNENAKKEEEEEKNDKIIGNGDDQNKLKNSKCSNNNISENEKNYTSSSLSSFLEKEEEKKKKQIVHSEKNKKIKIKTAAEEKEKIQMKEEQIINDVKTRVETQNYKERIKEKKDENGGDDNIANVQKQSETINDNDVKISVKKEENNNINNTITIKPSTKNENSVLIKNEKKEEEEEDEEEREKIENEVQNLESSNENEKQEHNKLSLSLNDNGGQDDDVVIDAPSTLPMYSLRSDAPAQPVFHRSHSEPTIHKRDPTRMSLYSSNNSLSIEQALPNPHVVSPILRSKGEILVKTPRDSTVIELEADDEAEGQEQELAWWSWGALPLSDEPDVISDALDAFPTLNKSGDGVKRKQLEEIFKQEREELDRQIGDQDSNPNAQKKEEADQARATWLGSIFLYFRNAEEAENEETKKADSINSPTTPIKSTPRISKIIKKNPTIIEEEQTNETRKEFDEIIKTEMTRNLTVTNFGDIVDQDKDDLPPIRSNIFTSSSHEIYDDSSLVRRSSVLTAGDSDNNAFSAAEDESVFSHLNLEEQKLSPFFGQVQLSRCGRYMGKNMVQNKRAFEKYKVSYEEFCENPGIVFDNNLIILSSGHLYPVRVALPLLLGYAAFNKPVSTTALWKLATEESYRHVHFRGEASDTDADFDVLDDIGTPILTAEPKFTEPTSLDLDSHSEGPAFSFSPPMTPIKNTHRSPPHLVMNSVSQDNPPSEPIAESDFEETQKLSSVPRESDVSADETPNGYQWLSVFDHGTKKQKRRKSGLAVKRKKKKMMVSTRPTSDMLKKMGLKSGRNSIQFIVESYAQGRQVVEAAVYLWPHNYHIVISDVDGTITKSDVLGYVMPWVGSSWSHTGVAEFFTNIENNGYQMLYLTARAIGQADLTRQYLFELLEQERKNLNSKEVWFVLPEGPVIMAPDSLLGAFHREVIKKRPQDFKIPALTDIRRLFPSDFNPFYCAFGNRMTDLVSYLAVGVPSQRSFIINPDGEIKSSNLCYQQTYESLNEFVEEMFVPLDPDKEFHVGDTFSNSNYWRDPFQALEDLPDLD